MTGRTIRVATAVAVLLALTATAGTAGMARGVLFVAPKDDGVITLLLLGSDAGPSPRSGDPRRSNADGFHLLFVTHNHRHATVVNIPRDAWVPVAGRGNGRINACLASGPDSCVATVEALFGIDVDHYLLASMPSFRRAFREFGGLVVDVDEPVSDGGRPIPQAGEQHLTGSQVLTYARDRKHRPQGDFDRTAAQGDVLRRAHATAVEGASVATIVDVVTIVRRHTLTDASVAELMRYAFAALELPPGNFRSVTLPGSVGFAGAASVVFLDGSAYDIVADASDGRLSS